MIFIITYLVCLLIAVITGWKVHDSDEGAGIFLIMLSIMPVINYAVVFAILLVIATNNLNELICKIKSRSRK